MTLSTAWIAQGNATASQGSGYDLDGSTGVVVLNNADVYSESNWSIFAEISPDVAESSTIFSFTSSGLDQSGGTVSEYLSLGLVQSGTRLKVTLTLWESDGTTSTITSTTEIKRNVYSRILLTAGTGNLYINGVLDATDFTFTKPTFSGLNRSLIGARIEGDAFTSFFNGKVKDLRLYNAELSAANATTLETDYFGPTGSMAVETSFLRAGVATINVGGSMDIVPRLHIWMTLNFSGKATMQSIKQGVATISVGGEMEITAGYVREGVATISPGGSMVINSSVERPGAATISPGGSMVISAITSRPAVATISVGGQMQVRLQRESLITGQDGGSLGNPSGLRPEIRLYRLEIRDSSGVLLRNLPNAYSKNLSQRVNRPDSLSFEIPSEPAINTFLDPSGTNEIWVRRLRDDRVISICDITAREDTRRAAGPVSIIEAMGLMHRLAEVTVDSYTPPASPTNTYKKVITDLLAIQIGANPITLHPGSDFPADEWPKPFRGWTILEAIQIMAATVRYQFRVNEEKQLEFTQAITPNQANTRRVRYGKNLINIKKRTSAESLVTRLYMYGAGQDDAQIRLSQADGHPTDYLDSVNYDANDPHEAVVYRKDIEDPNLLLAAAQAYLDEHDSVKITYEIEEAEAIGS